MFSLLRVFVIRISFVLSRREFVWIRRIVAAYRMPQNAIERVFVSFVAPARFDFLAVLVPESVRPSPLSGPADGVVYLTVSDSGLDFRLAYRELTGRAIGVRIRGPSDANGVAGILADFPIVDEAGTGAVVTGTLTQEFIRARDGRAAISMDSLVALIRNGATYVDVQTGEYFGGEIRGTLVHAP